MYSNQSDVVLTKFYAKKCYLFKNVFCIFALICYLFVVNRLFPVYENDGNPKLTYFIIFISWFSNFRFVLINNNNILYAIYEYKKYLVCYMFFVTTHCFLVATLFFYFLKGQNNLHFNSLERKQDPIHTNK